MLATGLCVLQAVGCTGTSEHTPSKATAVAEEPQEVNPPSEALVAPVSPHRDSHSLPSEPSEESPTPSQAKSSGQSSTSAEPKNRYCLRPSEISKLFKQLPKPEDPLPSTVVGLYAEAQTEGRIVVALYPESPDAYELLARMHLIAGEYAEATEAWNAALRVNSDFGYAYHGLGQVASRKGDFELAAQHHHRAVRLMPDFAEAKLRAAAAYSRLGELEKAQQLLTEYTGQQSEDSGGWTLLGQSLLVSGNYNKAYTAFQKALDIQANLREAMQGAAVALARLDRSEEAQAMGKRLRELLAKQRERERLDRNDTDALRTYAAELASKYSTLGSFYMAQQDFANAERILKRAEQMSPTAMKPKQALARLYVGLGKAEPALRVFQEMVNLEPNNTLHHYDLAMVYARLNRMDEVVATYEKAVSIQRDPQSLVYLAQAYFQSGQQKKALQTIEEAIEASPDSSELIQLRKQWLNAPQ